MRESVTSGGDGAGSIGASEAAVHRVGVRLFWYRIRRYCRSAPGSVGLSIILFWVAAALLAPLIAPYSPTRIDLQALADPTPSLTHWLGTDQIGRDVLSRILWGARTVLTVAPIAVLGATFVGTLVGLTAGYFGGWYDLLVMRCADIVLSFPMIILYMIVIVMFGASALNIILVISVTKAPIIGGSCPATSSQCGPLCRQVTQYWVDCLRNMTPRGVCVVAGHGGSPAGR